MDYMDLDVAVLKKAVKLNQSLTLCLSWNIVSGDDLLILGYQEI